MCRFGMEHLHGEEQPTGFLWRYARLFWLVKFAQLLSKCPSHTRLCQERSGTVSLRIPSVTLFQTACSVRASRVGENAVVCCLATRFCIGHTLKWPRAGYAGQLHNSNALQRAQPL